MRIGYIRVSTADQNTARQEVLMEELGAEKVFIDRCSGGNAHRPKLTEMMTFVRDGDTVIVESISRFARNTKDFLELVDKLAEKNVSFVSKKESIDTETPSGKFMLTVFAAMFEMERAYILQRQREGIDIAKRKGLYKGRKRIERENFDEVYRSWRAGEMTATDAMKKLKLSKTTFYRRVKEKG